MELSLTSTAPIYLGYQGEHLARSFRFPLAEWRAAYGEGTAQLLLRRPGEETLTPALSEADGDSLVWRVRGWDTALAGSGACQLQYYVGEALVKSRAWVTRVLPALSGGETSEEAEETLTALQEAESAALAAAAQAQSAATAAQSAAASAASATVDTAAMAERFYTKSEVNAIIAENAEAAGGFALLPVEDGEAFALSVPTTTRTLLYSWDFTQSLTDTVEGVTGVLQGGVSLTEDGVRIGDTNGWARFDNVFARGRDVDIDIALLDPSFTSGSRHGRFLMFGAAGVGPTEGLIFRNNGLWTWYLSGGWGSGYADVAQNAFSGKTLSVRTDEEGNVRVYVDGTFWALGDRLMPSTAVTVSFGAEGNAYTRAVISAMRIYETTTEE